MLKLVVKRLLSAIAVLFVVSLITFVVLLCIPGDPAQLILGVEATPEKVEALRASMGLDQLGTSSICIGFRGYLPGIGALHICTVKMFGR